MLSSEYYFSDNVFKRIRPSNYISYWSSYFVVNSISLPSALA